jgi:DNA modification methylase
MQDHKNTLYYGDNLFILREHIPSNSVDLIYLDPPFNSNRNYNVLFKDEHGTDSQAQIKAFDDTWHWGLDAEHAFAELLTEAPPHITEMIESMRDFIGSNQMMAYLVMMTTRLIELHRVLKPTGSIYLHCDPTASHYLKMILDTIFGVKQFRNEIIWCYDTGGRAKTNFPKKHDIIFWYSKTNTYIFNYDEVALPRDTTTMHEPILHDENNRLYQRNIKFGKEYRYYLDKGVLPNDWWVDIQALNPASKERLGYPTQKPLPLLERIIKAGSKPGDMILDPFCGCGTAVVAAEKLKRKWVGIDITHLGITAMKYRLNLNVARILTQ